VDLSRLLMFDPEVYLRLFPRYNEAIWPAPLISVVLVLFILTLVLKPRPGSDRVISAVLGLFWVWTGAVFHFSFFATINIAAPVYGALFVVQGGLFLWTGAIRGRLAFSADRLADCGRDFGLAAVALVFHPAVSIAMGGSWLDAPLAGLAPDATLVLTLGFLGLAKGPKPRHLLIIPALWCVIATLTAWLVAVPALWVLPVVAWVGLLHRLR